MRCTAVLACPAPNPHHIIFQSLQLVWPLVRPEISKILEPTVIHKPGRLWLVLRFLVKDALKADFAAVLSAWSLAGC